MSLGAYVAYVRMQAREDFANVMDVLIGTLTTLIFISLGLMLYAATGKAEFFGTFSWPMMAWYLILTQVIIRTIPDVVIEVNSRVQSGEIATRLTQPCSFPLAFVATQLMASTVTFLSCVLLVFPVGLALFGVGLFSLESVAVGVVVIFGGVLLSILLEVSIGLIAFWTGDAKPYSWVYGKIVFVFGGLLFPLEIFPMWLQQVAKLLPPAFMVYYPARLWVDFSWSLAGTVLLGQAIYLVAFALLLWAVHAAVRRKVEINGG